MKNILLIITSLLSLNTSAARLTDEKTKITFEQQEIKITTIKNFHLNAEAPASATFDNLKAIYKPVKKTEQLFAFKTPENSKIANLNFYVCDDKKTVCEQHQINFEILTAKVNVADAKPSPMMSNKMAPLTTMDGRPTLLVFSAPWCPACIRMQTETYPTSAVAKELSKVNFKKVNSDLIENFELAEKFHIKAIPTLILLNSQGEEVYRWLDFQTAQSFAKSLFVETKKLEKDSTSLLVKASQGDLEAASQLGMREYNTLNCAEAVKWLSLSKKSVDQNYKLAAEVSCAEDKASEDAKLKYAYFQTLEKAMILTSSEWDQLRWFVSWMEQKKEIAPLTEDVKAKAQSARKKIEAFKPAELKVLFANSTYGEAGGFEKEETLYSIATIDGLVGNENAKKKTQELSIKLISKKKLSVDRPGEMLMAIAYLREAGENKKVDQMYQALIKKYPQTYVYFEKYARLQLKNKNLEAALLQSEKALSYNEGNAPQLYLLKIRILKEMNKKSEAKTALDEAFNLKEISHPRFKKSFAQLKTLKEELNK